MTIVIIAAIAIITAVLIFKNAGTMSRFAKDYRLDGQFPGKRYECVVRFANFEVGTMCFVGADRSGLCLFPDRGHKRSWWSVRGSGNVFNEDLRIPWGDLEYRAGKMMAKDCLWFDIPSRKIHFYVPANVGEKLLTDAEREIEGQHSEG